MIKRILDLILGVERKSGTKWNFIEKREVLSLAPFTTDKRLAKKYNRTPQAIRQARYRLKHDKV